MAYSWETIKVMTVGGKVDLNADGNIKQSGETTASQKSMNLPGVKADANFAGAAGVYETFYGSICGGSFEEGSLTRSMKGGAVDNG